MVKQNLLKKKNGRKSFSQNTLKLNFLDQNKNGSNYKNYYFSNYQITAVKLLKISKFV